MKAKIKAIFLSDYIFWDHERQTEFLIKEYNWKESKVEGSYKHYKSVECKMAGVHDYAKFIKEDLDEEQILQVKMLELVLFLGEKVLI